MIIKPDFSASDWSLSTEQENRSPRIGTIFDHAVNPVPDYIDWDSGDKVQDLETIEKAVQLHLRTKHLYLYRVDNKYKLKKVIYPRQLVRNSNHSRGLPEDFGYHPVTKTSTIKYPPPTRASKNLFEEPETLLEANPEDYKLPWNFRRGTPNPIRQVQYSSSSSSDSDSESAFDILTDTDSDSTYRRLGIDSDTDSTSTTDTNSTEDSRIVFEEIIQIQIGIGYRTGWESTSESESDSDSEYSFF